MIKWIKWFIFYLLLAVWAHTVMAHVGLDMGLKLGSGSVVVGPGSSFFLLVNGTDSLLLANSVDKMIIN